MYCPECGAAYRDGITLCGDCRVALVTEPPGPAPDPHLEIVTVLESNDPLAIAFATGSLEEAGIPFYVAGEEGARYLHLYGASPHAPRRILVARDREAEARVLLRPLEDMQVADTPEEE